MAELQEGLNALEALYRRHGTVGSPNHLRQAAEHIRAHTTPSGAPSVGGEIGKAARWFTKIPGLAIAAIGIYAVATHVQDITAALGLEKIGDIPGVGHALRALGWNEIADTSFGAKNAALLGEFKAKGETVGKLSPEALAKLGSLPAEDQARLLRLPQTPETMAQLAAIDKLPSEERNSKLARLNNGGMGRADILAEGKPLATADKQVELLGKKADVNAKTLDIPALYAKYNVGIGPNGERGKKFTEAYEDGTYQRMIRDPALSSSASEYNAFIEGFGKAVKTELDAATQTAQISSANAAARKAEFGLNYLKGNGFGSYIPDSPTGGNSAPGSGNGGSGGPYPSDLRRGMMEFFPRG